MDFIGFMIWIILQMVQGATSFFQIGGHEKAERSQNPFHEKRGFPRIIKFKRWLGGYKFTDI